MATLNEHLSVFEMELAKMTKDGHFAEPQVDAMMRRLDRWLRQMHELNRKRHSTFENDKRWLPDKQG